MREIKFRAWASNDNYPDGKMFYPGDKSFAVTFFGDVIHNSTDNMLEGFTWARIAFNGLVLMQYTGLKDKNGKEIYEGDIVDVWHLPTEEEPHEDKNRAEVRFNKGQFWCTYYGFPVHSWACNDKSAIEVIGNIYENPELLGDKSKTGGRK
jgi:uncharacterized phage protein (TIGR01671 family)